MTINLALMSIKAAGATTSRTMADRLAEVKNVKDFGAVGNGIANDSPAIQAAITAAFNAGGGVVYFPPIFSSSAYYNIGSTITFPSGSGTNGVFLVGERSSDIHGSKLYGTITGWIISQVQGASQTLKGLHNLTIINFSTVNTPGSGGAVQFDNAQTGIVEGCTIHAYSGTGLLINADAYCVQVRNSNILGHGNVGTGVSGSQVSIMNCSITGWKTGVTANNVGFNISGTRLEVCDYAIRLGVDPNGTFSSVTGAVVQSCQTERCLVALDIIQASDCHVSGNGWTGTIGPGHTITNMVWSGGTMTVTSETPLANWSTWDNASVAWVTWTGSLTKLVKIEGQFDNGVFVTATRTGTNTFTYARSDPGVAWTGPSDWSFKPQFGTRVRGGSGIFLSAIGGGISNLEHANVDLYYDTGPGGVSGYPKTFASVLGGPWYMPPGSEKAVHVFYNCSQPTGTTNDGRGVQSGMVFADLPGQVGVNLSPKEGMEYDITNSNTATWGATVAGGGSNKVKVRYNGTNWTVMGA